MSKVRPLIMGVLNRTPDSFSDGGRYMELDQALEAAKRLIAEGAEILDIGGESTRPGAKAAPEEEELARVVPLVRAIGEFSEIPISVDTRKAAVARAAVAAGASLWNDVSALQGQESLETAAALGCQVVLMHMQGEPSTMQTAPQYGDVVAEVRDHLLQRAAAAERAGVERDRIILDPGIGFGKTTAHNLLLIAHLDQLVGTGYPVMVGASRKSFIGKVAGGVAPGEHASRLGGSIAVALAAARAGAAMIRVHDVHETAQALALMAAISNARA